MKVVFSSLTGTFTLHVAVFLERNKQATCVENLMERKLKAVLTNQMDVLLVERQNVFLMLSNT